MSKHEKSAVHLAWTAVTYRSVLMIIVLALIILGTISRLVFPEQTRAGLDRVMAFADRLVKPNLGDDSEHPGQQTASFTQFDGTVRVKKANSNLWVNADYTLPLEKGDVVQTGGEGIAKIVFADGTNYSLKQDSLDCDRGEVPRMKPSKPTWPSSSPPEPWISPPPPLPRVPESQVIVAGATASFAADSSAMVHNDPRADQHEIMVKRGSGEVSRKGETFVSPTTSG